MDALLNRVKRELDVIADKGITSSNLETTYKLIDIYKDIREIECMEGTSSDTETKRTHYTDERTERYLTRMNEGMSEYKEGCAKYRDGGSEARMIDGIEITMGAVLNFVESLMDYAETSSEKDIVRKYVNKLKDI
jgi:hypothetical protein